MFLLAVHYSNASLSSSTTGIQSGVFPSDVAKTVTLSPA